MNAQEFLDLAGKDGRLLWRAFIHNVASGIMPVVYIDLWTTIRTVPEELIGVSYSASHSDRLTNMSLNGGITLNLYATESVDDLANRTLERWKRFMPKWVVPVESVVCYQDHRNFSEEAETSWLLWGHLVHLRDALDLRVLAGRLAGDEVEAAERLSKQTNGLIHELCRKHFERVRHF